MASKSTVGFVAAGVGLLVGIGVAIAIIGLRGGEDTNVILARGDQGGPCRIVSKDNVLIRQPGNKVKWWIRDIPFEGERCGRDETVTIGNFRTTANSSNEGCQAATEGVAWPFDEDEAVENRRANRGGKIELKLESQGLERSYYFDICSGPPNGEIKADPRLVIEE